MDGKLNYPRFLLGKKPNVKTHIRREMTIFSKVSKTAVFCKIIKGELRENVPKMADFLSKIRKAEKIGNTSRIIA